jgi:hypothetical protein
MTTLYFILYLVSAVCFAASAVLTFRPAAGAAKVNLIALGLLFWVLVPLIVTAKAL